MNTTICQIAYDVYKIHGRRGRLTLHNVVYECFLNQKHDLCIVHHPWCKITTSYTFRNMVRIQRRFRGVLLTRLILLVRANSYQFSSPNRKDEYCSEMTSLFMVKESPLIRPPASPKPKQHGDQSKRIL